MRSISISKMIDVAEVLSGPNFVNIHERALRLIGPVV